MRRNAYVIAGQFFLALSVYTAAQNTNNAKGGPELSDGFAKAAIKYVVSLQNFELNAGTVSIVEAEARVESAKEDMEAAESTFDCDEKTAALGNGVACPEHMTSFSLEIDGLMHVTAVKTFHLGFEPKDKLHMDRSAGCIGAWKSVLQKRRKTRPLGCETEK
jgi:hypothetical protein